MQSLALIEPTKQGSCRERWGLGVFLLLVFGLAWGIELGPVRWLAKGKPLTAIADPMSALGVRLALAAVMWTPGIAALVARLVEKRGFADAGLKLGRGRWYLVAWLLPVVVAIIAAAATVLLGQADFDPRMTALGGGAPVFSGHSLPEVLRSPIFLWVVVPAASLTFGVAVTSLFSFGEEFGWRGYLQVRLMRIGAVRAMLLTGMIWGIWHAPIILQGLNYPQHPRLGVLLMVLFCIVWALILGWLRTASGSVFPCAVAHASINSPGVSTFAYLKGYDTAVGTLIGLVGISIAGLVVLWLWTTRRIRGGTDAIEG